jgi:hypothetical protein
VIDSDPEALDAGQNREPLDAARREKRPHRRAAELGYKT